MSRECHTPLLLSQRSMTNDSKARIVTPFIASFVPPSDGFWGKSEGVEAELTLWGKSAERNDLTGPYPLLGHLLDTAAAASAVCDLLIAERTREALVACAGANVGKMAF